jgi:hypothetical protein
MKDFERMLRSITWVMCVVLALAARGVAAQSGGDKAAADALFDQARALMREEKYREACAKFEASQALDPSVGALLNLANCYEKLGKTASAWALFRETVAAAKKSGSADRARIASERVKAIEPQLSYLTIVAPASDALEIARNGIPVAGAMLGVAIPVDPGRHTLVAKQPGKRDWSAVVEVGARGDRASVTVPVLSDASASAPEPARPEPTAPVATVSEPQAPAPAANGGSASPDPGNGTMVWNALTIGAAVVAVGGIVTGTIFGLKAMSTWDDATASCRPYPYCGPEAERLSDAAAGSGTISTVAFSVGAVALGATVALWLATPSAKDKPTDELSFAVSPTGVMVRGGF